MKRALLGLIIGTISFFIGFGIAVGYNWLIMKCFNPEYVEILDKVQEIEPSGDSIGSPSKPVTVCELKNDPARYNHSTVILTGYFSRGFEDSTLSDPSCESRQWIWVELGGTRSVDVMYCCGFTPRAYREQELEVEGISLPLIEDAKFDKYNRSLALGKNVKATVVGTFFSGTKEQYSKDEPAIYGGYGHMGIGSLFVVQEVLSSEGTWAKNK